jgi:hypothetical protein
MNKGQFQSQFTAAEDELVVKMWKSRAKILDISVALRHRHTPRAVAKRARVLGCAPRIRKPPEEVVARMAQLVARGVSFRAARLEFPDMEANQLERLYYIERAKLKKAGNQMPKSPMTREEPAKPEPIEVPEGYVEFAPGHIASVESFELIKRVRSGPGRPRNYGPVVAYAGAPGL